MLNSSLNKTEDFVIAYRSFDKCTRLEVLNYYSKYNHTNGIPKSTAIFILLAGVVFLFGGILVININQNNNSLRVANQNTLKVLMSRTENLKSVKINLDKYNTPSTLTNEYESTPKIDLASFEF